jgi:hypothetical protein
MKRVNLPGSYIITDDPPSTWRLRLWGVLTIIYVLWPVIVLGLSLVVVHKYS